MTTNPANAIRPVVFLDFETTTQDDKPDPGCDRIISLALIKIAMGEGGQELGRMVSLVNPGCPINPRSTRIHNITDDQVRKSPRLQQLAPEIQAFLAGCDLGGYNIIHYDVPLLWEEMFRCGIDLDLQSKRMFDAAVIFKKQEERTLTAALRFYCDATMEGAHGAEADTEATIRVLRGQMKRYSELGAMNLDQLAAFCQFERRLDLAGKLALNDRDEPVFAFGQYKGKRVKDYVGYVYWMLDKDFSENTKRVLRRLVGLPDQGGEHR